MVTVRSVPLYLAQVDATMRSMRTDPFLPCLLREARRVDGLFRMAPPLDPGTRAEIALHEWIAEGRRLTLAMARRAKRAILNVGTYAVIHGLAAAWGGTKKGRVFVRHSDALRIEVAGSPGPRVAESVAGEARIRPASPAATVLAG